MLESQVFNRTTVNEIPHSDEEVGKALVPGMVRVVYTLARKKSHTYT